MAKTKMQRLQPTLAEVLAALRARLPELRERYGIRSLGVFGSYVRGEQGRGSDVDVLVEFEEEARPSLLDLVRLQDEVSGALGVKVDLGEKKSLKPFIGRRVLREVVWLMGGDKGAGQPPTGAGPDREREKIATDFIPPLEPALRQALGAEIRARGEDGSDG